MHLLEMGVCTSLSAGIADKVRRGLEVTMPSGQLPRATCLTAVHYIQISVAGILNLFSLLEPFPLFQVYAAFFQSTAHLETLSTCAGPSHLNAGDTAAKRQRLLLSTSSLVTQGELPCHLNPWPLLRLYVQGRLHRRQSKV